MLGDSRIYHSLINFVLLLFALLHCTAVCCADLCIAPPCSMLSSVRVLFCSALSQFCSNNTLFTDLFFILFLTLRRKAAMKRLIERREEQETRTTVSTQFTHLIDPAKFIENCLFPSA